MKQEIYSINPIALLRYYDEEEYSNDFLDGKLYFNTFRNISKMQDSVDRGDAYELIHEQVISDKITIPLINRNMSVRAVRHLDGKYTLQYMDDEFLANMFCLFAITAETDFEQFQYTLSEDMKLGTHLVAINNVGKFFARLEDTLKESKLDYVISPIKYVDMNVQAFKKSYFEKPIKFSYQKELRVAFKNTVDQPEFINIGDIRDIASKVPFGTKTIKFHKDKQAMLTELKNKQDKLTLEYANKMIQFQMLIDNNSNDILLLEAYQTEAHTAKQNLVTFLQGLQYKD